MKKRISTLKRRSHKLEKTKLISIANVAHLTKDPDALIAHMDQDKKNEGGTLTLILAKRIGKAFVQKGASRIETHNYLKTLSEKLDSK